MTTHVFAYGTLMYPEVWQAVVGHKFVSVRGRLSHHAIHRVKDAVFPGIVATVDEHSVPGVVYLEVDGGTLERLDRFEDDFYVRMKVPVVCDDGIKRECDTYVVPPENRAMLTDESWTGEDFIARGDLERFIARFGGFGRIARDKS